jgi:anti-sigma B factor antagonist
VAGRRESERDLFTALSHPLRRRILREMLNRDGETTPGELAERLGEKLSALSYHVRALAACGAIELVGIERDDCFKRHLYRPVLREAWALSALEDEGPPEGCPPLPGPVPSALLSPAPFKVRSEQQDGVFVIAVEGELDMSTAPALERELEAPVAAGDSSVLLDLSACEFIDSTGIALVVHTWQTLDGEGDFALCGMGDQVKRVLDITGLDDAIPMHASREKALAQLRS